MRTLSLVTLGLAIAGCSGGGLQTHDAGVDMPGADLSTVHDMAMRPMVNTGTQITAANIDFIAGVTTDDYVAYYQGTTLSAIAIAANATAKQIDANSQLPALFGKTVMSYSVPDMTTNTIKLTAWTSAGGAHVLSTDSLLVQDQNTFITYGAAGNADGSQVVFLDNVSADGMHADVVLANADGTGKLTLAAQSNIATCNPEVKFAGARILVVHCPDPTDAGVTQVTISSYDTGGAGVDLSTNAQIGNAGSFWSLSSAGDKAVLYDANGSLVLVSTDGSTAPVTLDPAAGIAHMAADGSRVVWIDANGALKSAATATPATVTVLVQTGIAGFLAFSPDDKWVEIYENSGGGFTTDIFVTSTTVAGAPVTLDSMTDGFIFIDGFTADSTNAIYFDMTDPNLQSGTLHTIALPANGQAKTISPNVWEAFGPTAAKLIYNNEYTQITIGTGMNAFVYGHADVHASAIDGTNDKLIVTQADRDLFFSTAKDKVVYNYRAVPGKEALFFAPIP